MLNFISCTNYYDIFSFSFNVLKLFVSQMIKNIRLKQQKLKNNYKIFFSISLILLRPK